MAATRPWLPANAVRDGALSKAIAARAEQWAARWFAAPRTLGVRMTEVKSRLGLPSDSVCWTNAGGSTLLAMGPTAHVPISSAMLGIETSAHKLTSQDHAVLRQLAAQCARDFLQTIGRMFSLIGETHVTHAREVRSGFGFALSLGAASQVLELYLDEPSAIAARRSMLGEPVEATRPLRSRADAIGQQPIVVGAMIGVGKLGLGDLQGLACGDVLVLDRGPNDPLALAINGVACPGTPCSIVADGDLLHLRMNTTEHGGPR